MKKVRKTSEKTEAEPFWSVCLSPNIIFILFYFNILKFLVLASQSLVLLSLFFFSYLMGEEVDLLSIHSLLNQFLLLLTKDFSLFFPFFFFFASFASTRLVPLFLHYILSPTLYDWNGSPSEDLYLTSFRGDRKLSAKDEDVATLIHPQLTDTNGSYIKYHQVSKRSGSPDPW